MNLDECTFPNSNRSGTPPDPADRNVRLVRTADGFDTLRSSAYGQTFHSVHGARTEAEHVFLRGAGIETHLAAGRAVRILEVGFGAGLNFLVTTRLSNARVEYTALENALLPPDIFARLNHAELLGCPSLEAWRRTLAAEVPPGTYIRRYSPLCTLRLIVGDAAKVPIPGPAYHAVYLDAFSPDVNPELWTSAFLSRLLAALEPGGRLATYSARGAVRRRLEACGFDVERRPGPPGKRETLAAVRPR